MWQYLAEVVANHKKISFAATVLMLGGLAYHFRNEMNKINNTAGNMFGSKEKRENGGVDRVSQSSTPTKNIK